MEGSAGNRYVPGPRGQERGTAEVTAPWLQLPVCWDPEPGNIRRAYEEAHGTRNSHICEVYEKALQQRRNAERAQTGRRCWTHCPDRLELFFQPEELLRRIPRAARPSRLEPWRIGGLSEEQKLMSDSYLFDMSRILATGAAHAN